MHEFIVSEHLEFDRSQSTCECQCEYDVEYYDIGLYRKYNIEIPQSIISASQKRQAEFLAGRYAAIAALNAMGVYTNQIPIAENRSPIWPIGIKGSIAHTDSKAITIVSNSVFLTEIGVDMEPWISKQVSKEISEEILTPDEHELLHTFDYPFERLLTVCFSAKESVYKAIFGQIKWVTSFKQLETVSITLGEKGMIKIILSEDIVSKLPQKKEYLCTYSNHKNETITRLISPCDRI